MVDLTGKEPSYPWVAWSEKKRSYSHLLVFPTYRQTSTSPCSTYTNIIHQCSSSYPPLHLPDFLLRSSLAITPSQVSLISDFFNTSISTQALSLAPPNSPFPNLFSVIAVTDLSQPIRIADVECVPASWSAWEPWQTCAYDCSKQRDGLRLYCCKGWTTTVSAVLDYEIYGYWRHCNVSVENFVAIYK